MSTSTGTRAVSGRRVSNAAPAFLAPAFLAPALLTGVSTALWVASLRPINLDAIGQAGLITTLGPLSFVALGLLIIAFCWALQAPVLRPRVLLVQVLALTGMLHGLASAVEPIPRFVTAWLHAGFVDVIARTGHVLPHIDGRFNWPGLFAASAMLSDIAGRADETWLLRWAPLVFNLLYLLPFSLIIRSAVTNERARWVAMWLFVLGGWIGQDYFSPQAFGYFLFLVILAVMLRYFDRNPIAAADARQRGVLVGAVLLMFCAITVSHPLTPFFVLAATTVLALTRRTTLRTLPILLVVILGIWFSYGAVDYWSGHLQELVSQVGAINQAVQSNVVSRLQGDAGRLIVQGARLGLTAAVGLLAGIGFLRRRPPRWHDWNIALLAVTPFPLLVLQSYGGELLLRAVLFALPFLAMLGALAFFPEVEDRQPSRRAVVAIAGVSLLLVPGFLLARYGNERFERITPGELTAMEFIYTHAEPGDRIVTAVPYNALWRYRDIEQYDHRPLTEANLVLENVDQIREQMMVDGEDQAFFAITQGQGAIIEATRDVPPGWAQDLANQMRRSGGFRVVHESPDATVFVLDTAVTR
jgi:hypothetical protein